MDAAPKIFISYRHSDTEGADATDRLAEQLRAKFGESSVFYDQESLKPGVNWRDHVRERLPACNIVVAVIGSGWGDVTGPDDPIRFEFELARQQGLTILPVLARGASMPGAEAFPEALQDLSDVIAVSLAGRGDAYRQAVQQLIGIIETRCPSEREGVAADQEDAKGGRSLAPRAFVLALVIAGAITAYLWSSTGEEASPEAHQGQAAQVVATAEPGSSAPRPTLHLRGLAGAEQTVKLEMEGNHCEFDTRDANTFLVHLRKFQAAPQEWLSVADEVTRAYPNCAGLVLAKATSEAHTEQWDKAGRSLGEYAAIGGERGLKYYMLHLGVHIASGDNERFLESYGDWRSSGLGDFVIDSVNQHYHLHAGKLLMLSGKTEEARRVFGDVDGGAALGGSAKQIYHYGLGLATALGKDCRGAVREFRQVLGEHSFGFRITPGPEDTGAVVSGVYPRSGLDAESVRVGDRLVVVDGLAARGATFEVVERHMYRAPGERVSFELEREGDGQKRIERASARMKAREMWWWLDWWCEGPGEDPNTMAKLCRMHGADAKRACK